MKKTLLTLLAAVFTLAATAQDQAPAFPGAEGHGRYVTGGRASVLMDSSGLSAGTNIVTASYSGDNNWTSASGTAEFYAKYQTNMKVLVNDVIVGKNSVIRVTVPKNATGTITCTIPDYYKRSAQPING